MDLYVFFDCNEWKEYSSFRFICVVDHDHYMDAYEKIKKERGYSDEEMETFIYIEETTLNDLENI